MFYRPAMTIAFLAALCGAAFAQGRPDARAMSCDQVHAMIHARGAVVLTTGRHTYDRYVADGRFCMAGEAAVLQSIRTRDANDCPVRACRIESYGPFDLFRD